MTNDNPFEGAEVPPDAEDWIRANPHEARRILEDIERGDAQEDAQEDALPPPTLEWADKGDAAFPKAILGCAAMGGAVLSEGEVCVLSAAGGAGKSTLAASTALSIVMANENLHEPMQLESGIFHGTGGKVLYASYEDPPAVLRWKLQKLAHLWDYDAKRKYHGRATSALDRVGLVSMRRWPLYGPVGERASYNTVPDKMDGWRHLWKLVDEVQPVLIIIDPALTAFVGDANSPTQVMTFLDALSSEAGKRRAGVLLLAHSTKSSRAATADPFHPGMVSGTGAWTDHVRGVLTMGEYQHKTPKSGKAERGSEDDSGETMLVLRVYKANWGPSRITLRLQTQMPKGNATPVAFVADGPWGPGPAPGALPRSKTNGGKAAEETTGPMEDEFDDFG